MAKQNKRYLQMQKVMTRILIGDAVAFLLYLIFAACGVIWLKVILAVGMFVVSGGCLAFLYLTRELTRRRSLWMTTASGGILICLLFSLILNFP